ncbi:carboxymuconolactone decarboxylase family protein [Vibrio sp. TRT 1302]|uniref:carboxymuconolactone decarboxylase family protein n=1 Tax=Vibrio sp. TRT 1302 TaxID=3418504 RepID=UPI003CF8E9D4
MSNFTIHSIESAPAASAPLLKKAQQAYGFVPNLLSTMAESPTMLTGYLQLTDILNQGELTETERQIVLMTNNRLNGCKYCMAAHTTISQMQGINAEVIEALRNNTPIGDPKLEALRTFSAVINDSRGWPTELQLAEFFAAGYSKAALMEVIVATSLKVMSNYTNHIAETPLDKAFSANAWSESAA